MKVDYQSPVGLHSIDKWSDRLCISKQALMISPCQHSGAVDIRPQTADGASCYSTHSTERLNGKGSG